MQTVPLTAHQRLRLAGRFMPLFFWIAAFGAVTLVPQRFVLEKRMLILGFTGIFIVWELVNAAKAFRDLTRGVALVDEDYLEQTSSGRTSHYGRFTRLGRLTLTPAASTDAVARLRYRVVYSPATGIVWAVELL